MARNKYAGYCYECGKWIKPGYGRFERFCGTWRIHCVQCTSGRILTEDDPGIKWVKEQNKKPKERVMER